MLTLKKLFLMLTLFAGMVLTLAVSAAAYLDPSAMTYVIQAVAGVVIASGAALVIYWKKIKLFFKKKAKKKAAVTKANEEQPK